MSSPKRDSSQAVYPEVVPVPESANYTYSIGDDNLPTKHTAAPTNVVAPYYYNGLSEERKGQEVNNGPGRRNCFMKWPILLLFGLLIAVLAGLVGGFVGKVIEDNRLVGHSNGGAVDQSQGQACRTNSSSTPTPTSPTTTLGTPTATPTASTLIIPTTGCDPPTRQYSFKSFSEQLDMPYTTFCNTGWLSDDLFAISVASPSDCIESCAFFNSQATGRRCIGGGFIPEWTNQSAAMRDIKMPFNCYMKSNDSTIGRNDRNIEVVSLCLEGNCKGVIGS